MKSMILDALEANFGSDVMARFVMNLVKQNPSGVSDIIFSEGLRMKCLEYLDCCCPDYFAGSNLPTLAVPVYRGITGKELKEAIINGYNNMDDSFPELNIEKAVDAFVLLEDEARMFEWLEEGNYDCYLYIGVVEEE